MALRDEFFRKVGHNTATFKALFDSIPDAMFCMVDAQDRIMCFNRADLEHCNFLNEDEIIGRPIGDVFPPILAEIYIAREHEVRSTGIPIVNRIYRRSGDRSIAFRLATSYPVRDHAGNIIGTATLYRAAKGDAEQPDWMKAVHKSIIHIEKHFAEHLPLDELARIAGMSVSAFLRTFAKVMKCTPSEHIATIRINHARNLLATTSLTIADIALQCGFYDQSHFIRTFKRLRRQTPAQYRRAHFST